MRYYWIHIRMVKNNTKYCGGCRETGILILCWLEGKMDLENSAAVSYKVTLILWLRISTFGYTYKRNENMFI